MKQEKTWLWVFASLLLVAVLGIMALVYRVAPYFRYHSPDTDTFYYDLDIEKARNLSDGLVKHVPCQGMIVGTSMTENFSASQAEALFGGSFVKAPLPGCLYAEQDALIRTALQANPELKLVIRSMDMYNYEEDSQRLQSNLEAYPGYVREDGFLGQVSYLLNRDVFYREVLPMVWDRLQGRAPGMDDFDGYGAWSKTGVTGREKVLSGRESFCLDVRQQPLSQESLQRIRENIQEHVLDVAKQYPDTQFYCFLPPYSAAWWGELVEKGKLDAQLEAERLVIELLLPQENIHLFSWNTNRTLTEDLNNYHDTIHYAYWVNEWMLEQMAAGEGTVTRENYLSYLEQEREVYTALEYNALFSQPDSAGTGIPAFFAKEGM